MKMVSSQVVRIVEANLQYEMKVVIWVNEEKSEIYSCRTGSDGTNFQGHFDNP
jgi:hypothetical protein